MKEVSSKTSSRHYFYLLLPTKGTTSPHMRDIYMWTKLENKELNYALKECL